MSREGALKLAVDTYLSAIGETDPDPALALDYLSGMLFDVWALVEQEGGSPPLVAMRSLRRYSDHKQGGES
jgi:hypothetical protein